MAQVPGLVFRVEYNNHDITRDLSAYIESVEYNDATEGESDDVAIVLDNTDMRFLNAWAFVKKDKIKVWMGIGDIEVFCGTFTIDEPAFTWGPNTCELKALAAASNSPIRTKKNRQLEQVTLRQIAQTIADENGLTLVDGSPANKISINLDKERAALKSAASTIRSAINANDRNVYLQKAVPVYVLLKATADSISDKGYPDDGLLINSSIKIASGIYYGGSLPDLQTAKAIVLEFVGKLESIANKLQSRSFTSTHSILENIQIEAITQIEKTDIAFLYELGMDYGIIFNIRDTDLIFTSIYDLDGAEGITKMSTSNFKPGFKITDSMTGTYKAAELEYHLPEENELIQKRTNLGDDSDSHQLDEFSANEDILRLKGRVENVQQAEAKTKAALHRANSGGAKGNGGIPGNPLMIAGINFLLEDAGYLSGKYQVTKSSHRQEKGGGYETTIEIKGVDKLPPGANSSGTPTPQGTDVTGVYGKSVKQISSVREAALRTSKLSK